VVTDDGISGEFEIEKRELEKIGAELIITQCHTEEELIKATKDADALLNIGVPITRKVIENLKKCKIIGRYGIGVDNVDVKASTERGIMVVNVPDYCIDELSTHTLSLLLSCARKIVEANELVKNFNWGFKKVGLIHRLSTQKLGLVGFGNSARAVSCKAKSFGLSIFAYDPYVSAKVIRGYEAIPVELNQLLKESDFVSIHTPLTKQTKYLFNQKKFKIMKRTAFLINTARGAIIKEKDLYKALTQGWIAGAALDVLEHEPPDKDNPLLKLPNVIITPHIGGYSEDSSRNVKVKLVKEVIKVLSGSNPRSIAIVNPEVINRR